MQEQRKILLTELPQPFVVRPVKIEGIERYDQDNAYPSRMERIILGSVTAKSSAKMLARFLIGNGFKDQSLNTLIIGRDRYNRPVTAYKLLKQIAFSVAYFNGYYIRAQFDLNYNTTGFSIEDFKNCRLGLKDSQDYSGKVVIYNNWDKSKSSRMDKKSFLNIDVWNSNEKAISAQIKKAGDIKKYKGQVYFNFLDEYYIYPLSPIDPVLYDADTENQISKFKNGELRRGFFLKYIIHHTAFESKKDADEFKALVEKMIGGGHQISSMVIPGSFNDDGTLKKEENIAISKIDQNINDKIFEAYENSCINNIRKAFNAIPQILIDYEDGKLGTTSGEALFQASQFYNQQTIELRMSLQESFRELFVRWKDQEIRSKSWEIEPLKLGMEGTAKPNVLQLFPEKGNGQYDKKFSDLESEIEGLKQTIKQNGE